MGERDLENSSGIGTVENGVVGRKLASEKWKRGIMKECNFARIFGMIV